MCGSRPGTSAPWQTASGSNDHAACAHKRRQRHESLHIEYQTDDVLDARASVRPSRQDKIVKNSSRGSDAIPGGAAVHGDIA